MSEKDDSKNAIEKSSPTVPTKAGQGSASLARRGLGLLKIRADQQPKPLVHQEKGHKVGDTMRVTLPGGIEIAFCYIPAGEFLMGSPEDEEERNDDEGPVHRVVISQPFWLGKYQVTQVQWESVMGNNPSEFKGRDLPVENVNWYDCQEFIRQLNEKGDGIYRLPTEAEWEYACRAGTTGDYAGNLDEMGWHYENAGDETHPVGQKQANGWGLYDMHGNIWEWCADRFGKDYYKESPTNDPTGPSSGSYRVFRGGSWNFTATACRSPYRDCNSPGDRDGDLGFRLVKIPT